MGIISLILLVIAFYFWHLVVFIFLIILSFIFLSYGIVIAVFAFKGWRKIFNTFIQLEVRQQFYAYYTNEFYVDLIINALKKFPIDILSESCKVDNFVAQNALDASFKNISFYYGTISTSLTNSNNNVIYQQKLYLVVPQLIKTNLKTTINFSTLTIETIVEDLKQVFSEAIIQNLIALLRKKDNLPVIHIENDKFIFCWDLPNQNENNAFLNNFRMIYSKQKIKKVVVKNVFEDINNLMKSMVWLEAFL